MDNDAVHLADDDDLALREIEARRNTRHNTRISSPQSSPRGKKSRSRSKHSMSSKSEATKTTRTKRAGGAEAATTMGPSHKPKSAQTSATPGTVPTSSANSNTNAAPIEPGGADTSQPDASSAGAAPTEAAPREGNTTDTASGQLSAAESRETQSHNSDPDVTPSVETGTSSSLDVGERSSESGDGSDNNSGGGGGGNNDNDNDSDNGDNNDNDNDNANANDNDNDNANDNDNDNDNNDNDNDNDNDDVEEPPTAPEPTTVREPSIASMASAIADLMLGDDSLGIGSDEADDPAPPTPGFPRTPRANKFLGNFVSQSIDGSEAKVSVSSPRRGTSSPRRAASSPRRAASSPRWAASSPRGNRQPTGKPPLSPVVRSPANFRGRKSQSPTYTRIFDTSITGCFILEETPIHTFVVGSIIDPKVGSKVDVGDLLIGCGGRSVEEGMSLVDATKMLDSQKPPVEVVFRKPTDKERALLDSARQEEMPHATKTQRFNRWIAKRFSPQPPRSVPFSSPDPALPAASPMARSAERVGTFHTTQGYLEKKGTRSVAYKTVYFVLQGQSLCYWPTLQAFHAGVEPSGVYNLVDLRDEEPVHIESRTLILYFNHRKKRRLKAIDQRRAIGWGNAICRAIGRAVAEEFLDSVVRRPHIFDSPSVTQETPARKAGSPKSGNRVPTLYLPIEARGRTNQVLFEPVDDDSECREYVCVAPGRVAYRRSTEYTDRYTKLAAVVPSDAVSVLGPPITVDGLQWLAVDKLAAEQFFVESEASDSLDTPRNFSATASDDHGGGGGAGAGAGADKVDAQAALELQRALDFDNEREVDGPAHSDSSLEDRTSYKMALEFVRLYLKLEDSAAAAASAVDVDAGAVDDASPSATIENQPSEAKRFERAATHDESDSAITDHGRDHAQLSIPLDEEGHAAAKRRTAATADAREPTLERGLEPKSQAEQNEEQRNEEQHAGEQHAGEQQAQDKQAQELSVQAQQVQDQPAQEGQTQEQLTQHGHVQEQGVKEQHTPDQQARLDERQNEDVAAVRAALLAKIEEERHQAVVKEEQLQSQITQAQAEAAEARRLAKAEQRKRRAAMRGARLVQCNVRRQGGVLDGGGFGVEFMVVDRNDNNAKRKRQVAALQSWFEQHVYPYLGDPGAPFLVVCGLNNANSEPIGEQSQSVPSLMVGDIIMTANGDCARHPSELSMAAFGRPTLSLAVIRVLPDQEDDLSVTDSDDDEVAYDGSDEPGDILALFLKQQQRESSRSRRAGDTSLQ